VPQSCLAFAQNSRQVLGASAELRRIFTAHLVTLYEYCLLDADQMDACLRILDQPAATPAP
jgi:hypothetical protein